MFVFWFPGLGFVTLMLELLVWWFDLVVLFVVIGRVWTKLVFGWVSCCCLGLLLLGFCFCFCLFGVDFDSLVWIMIVAFVGLCLVI